MQVFFLSYIRGKTSETQQAKSNGRRTQRLSNDEIQKKLSSLDPALRDQAQVYNELIARIIHGLISCKYSASRLLQSSDSHRHVARRAISHSSDIRSNAKCRICLQGDGYAGLGQCTTSMQGLLQDRITYAAQLSVLLGTMTDWSTPECHIRYDVSS